MSTFITPIAIAVVSTLLFFFLAGKLNGSDTRYKISIGMMLVGLWMFVAGGSLLYIAMRIPVKPTLSLATLTNFAIASGGLTVAGFTFMVLGALAWAWKYSYDVVERAENPPERPKFSFAPIQGDLAAVPVPAVPMYRNGRHKLEPVQQDWPYREFPQP